MTNRDFSLDVAVVRLRKLDQRARSMRVPRPNPVDEACASYREAWGKTPFGARLRAPYYRVIGEAPSGRFLGRDDAARYLAKINLALDMDEWTPKERGRLMCLRKKWQKRANGEDARYLRFGTTGGRRNCDDRPTVAQTIAQIREAIAESTGVVSRYEVHYTHEWPFGRPVIR